MSNLNRPGRRLKIFFALLFGVSVLSIATFALVSAQKSRPRHDRAQLDFLKSYWQTPIPLQGTPPKTFSDMEASLDPASCGICHQTQYDDWKTTIHSRSVGPGLLGQTPSFLSEEPDTAVMCYTCHAPLSEQQEVVRLTPSSDLSKNSKFDAALQSQGLSCAACHVRNYKRYGPPRRDGSGGAAISADEAPHGGAALNPAFEKAEFCMGCHQFEEGDRSVNGKFIENTYNEWKAGPYSKQGVACQQCHMPDRRHIWRGIHDAEMVRSGVTIALNTSSPAYEVGGKLEATLTITNSGVGHFFPTYVTPQVFLRIELIDSNGSPVPESAKEEVIGRGLSLDLEEELYDTRIPPKQTHSFRYSHVVGAKGLRLRAVVTVHPDDFYRKFYEAKLEEELLPQERTLLTEALKHSQQSVYTLYTKEIPVS